MSVLAGLEQGGVELERALLPEALVGVVADGVGVEEVGVDAGSLPSPRAPMDWPLRVTGRPARRPLTPARATRRAAVPLLA